MKKSKPKKTANNAAYIGAAVLLLVLVGLVLVMLRLQSTAKSAAASPQVAATSVGVDQLMADPGAYTGVISMGAAVSFVHPESSSFVVIDLREYDKCGVVTCAINQLPVNYAGTLPAVKDRVSITGTLARTNQGYVFNAQTVNKQ